MSYLGTSKREASQPNVALTIAVIVIAVSFLIMAARLWQLQLLSGEQFRSYAEKIATERDVLPAPRGNIRARGGEILAKDVETFQLLLTPEIAKDHKEHTIERLAEMTNLSKAELNTRWSKVEAYSKYKPSVFIDKLSYQEFASFRTYRHEMPGIGERKRFRRVYPHGEMFAHTVGYLGEVTEQELEDLSGHGYKRGHNIGKKGVELLSEADLKGAEGLEYVPKDRLGRPLGAAQSEHVLNELMVLARHRHPASAGHDVYLTIDMGLQKAIADAFGDKAGAVVAVEVDNGFIRAMYNHPTFDPESFTRGLSHAEWSLLRDHPDHPLNDKALRGMYPPGSTWKVVTAAAALKYGETTPTEKVRCRGSMRFGNRNYRCWKRGGHGVVQMKTAIQRSCDVYFYTMGLRVGIDRLAVVARDFGFGTPTGVGINDEKGGLVPTREWKRMNRYEEWQEGETLSAAIGQGFDLATPIQLVMAYAAIANGGTRYRPRIVEEVKMRAPSDSEAAWADDVKPARREPIAELALTEEIMDQLREGLFAVVNEPGGTAYWAARIPEIPVAGKTGTSQVIRQDERAAKVTLERFKDHALFAAYAPAEDPELAVAVIVEHGGHGSTGAAPIAKAAFEYWFRKRIEEAKEQAKADRAAKKKS